MTLLIGQDFREQHDFMSPAIMPDHTVESGFQLSDYIDQTPAVLFFYTMDFSYICPTELVALNNRMAAFQERGVKVVAINGDSHLSHQQWREKSVYEGGVGNLQFPMVADMTRDIAKAYDVLINNSLCLRGTFLIDQEGYFRHQSINDLPVGRNIDEILRIIDALQLYQMSGQLCPANWQKGEPGLIPEPEKLQDFMQEKATEL